jgi:plastocyanin
MPRHVFLKEKRMRMTRVVTIILMALTGISMNAADVTVQVVNPMSFDPAAVTINTGDTVTWFFQPGGTHTTTSDATSGPEVWNSGFIPGGSTFSHTFNTPGVHEYYCQFHSSAGGTSMNGVVIVNPPETVFHSLAPCVVFDTRAAFGGPGPFVAEQERSFHVAGSTANFAAQGGTAGGCGVPAFDGGQPVATAIFINYVAINANGGGSLKAWAGDKTEPVQGAVLNYQALTPPLNTSNGVVTELRADVQGNDIKVKAKTSGVDVRGIILGYFSRGHISSIIAGEGLEGGGDSGDVTIAVSDKAVTNEKLSPTGSAIHQVLKSTGTAVIWANLIPTGSGPPAAPDCDASSEAGRAYFDTIAQTLYVCSGASGWAAINPVLPGAD